MKMNVVGNGITPPKNPGDCGYDLYAVNEVTIPACDSVVVNTGVYLEIPEGYFGKIFSRSGLSVKHDIEVGAGVIDSGYRGEILVHVYNHSFRKVTIPFGKAIAQIVIMPCVVPELNFVEFVGNSDRGTQGFGSTDVTT